MIRVSPRRQGSGILGGMTGDPATISPSLQELGTDVDTRLLAFLGDKRAALSAVHPAASTLADELGRMVRAGGRRLRPALGYWGYRLAGGRPDGRIIGAAASLELFHTFALVHDDLMDDADLRRDVASVHANLVKSPALSGAPDSVRAGVSAAILIGDLAAVWADELLLTSGFGPVRVVRALVRAYAVRGEMAVGQFLDVAGYAAADEGAARLAANLKGGRYTVTGPLLIGAELANDDPIDDGLLHSLVAFGEPLGEAFQLRDDLQDGDAAHRATGETVDALVEGARGALASVGGDPIAIAALAGLAEMI
jgi:geranylgeranyl diphosphate synthase, type I